MTEFEIVKLLRRRGFFIEHKGDHLVLSDNAHCDDIKYLSELLVDNDIGYVQDKVINIAHSENGYRLNSLFDKTPAIQDEACWFGKSDWNRFMREQYGTKVHVRVLESNIAYYCKAISECGLKTVSSCDGNHTDGNSKMFIVFLSPPYTYWHKLLWQHILSSKFKIEWNSEYNTIYINADSKENIYNELNEAADYLYTNRIKFRDLKKQASAFLTKSYCQHHSQKEIEKQLADKLQILLSEHVIQL